MTPDDGAAETNANGVEQFGAADFVVLVGREASDDEIAVLAENEKAVAVLGDEGGAFVGAATVAVLSVDGFRGGPQSFAGVNAHGAKDAVAVDAVGDFVFDEGCAADR